MFFPAVFPLCQITFLKPPKPPPTPQADPLELVISQPMFLWIVLAIALAGALVALKVLLAAWRHRRTNARPWILVDGSNVMHWKNERPQIATVHAVVVELERRGFAAGVVFDANAGYKLTSRYMGEREFSSVLGLPESQILVVPKGTQADSYLLDAARKFGARVVTRDRFRDWAEAYPEVLKPGFLVRGGYRDSGALWIEEGGG